MVDTILPLELKDVVVRKRGKTIIGPVNYRLGEAGMTIIMGPNGSGKTTLLRLMHGLERPRKGEVRWSCETEIARKHQAFVFQSPIMLRRTAFENITYALKLNKKPITQAENTARDWLQRVGLENIAELNAVYLSGGEKQKLALARALACEPQLLFLDEPTANLDGRATREIEAVLSEARQQGLRIVMTTHDTGQARRLADDILFLYRGKPHEDGEATSFFTQPKTKEAEAFLNGDIVE